MFQDRRSYQRVTPSSPQLVLLDESKYSLLFDLSEGGLAVEGFSAEKSPELFSLEFDLPESYGCIQAKAEIVWKSDSGYRTGFRFVELADNYRGQLRGWLSSDLTAHPPLSGIESAKPGLLPDNTGSFLEPFSAKNEPAEKHPPAALFPLTWGTKFESSDAQSDSHPFNEQRPPYTAIILLAVVMSSIAFLMGYYWRGTRTQLVQRPRPVAGKMVPATSAASANQQPMTILSPPTAASLDQTGFVLQVGAMKEESNADVLSDTLRQKNFQAFVFKRDGDHLYRVVVGPFASKESAVQIQGPLEAQGLKPLLRPWSPQ